MVEVYDQDYFSQFVRKDGSPAPAKSEVPDSKSLLDIVLETGKSAVYTGGQVPLQGAAQLIDHFAKTDLQRTVTFMEAPKPAQFGSADWHIQQVGNALGIAVPFYFLNRGVGKLLPKAAATAETVGIAAFKRPVLQAAITGGVFDGVFKTSLTGEDFGPSRFKNAFAGATTFVAMSSTAMGLHEFAGWRNRIGIGAASGLPAGLVSVELNSRLYGHAPTTQERAEGAYSFAFAGGLLSAVHRSPSKVPEGQRAEKAEAATPQVEKSPQGADQSRQFKVTDGLQALAAFRKGANPTAWLSVREALGDGTQGPKRTLFIQHNEGEALATEASKADLLAFCDPQGHPLAARHVLPRADTVWMQMLDHATVSFLGERPAGEAMALGKKAEGRNAETRKADGKAVEGLSVRDVLKNEELSDLMAAIPKSLSKVRLTGEVWQGDSSYAFPLVETDGSTPAVLKITTQEWRTEWGRRPFDAAILTPKFEVDPEARVHEGQSMSGVDTYTYLQERVDTDTRGQMEDGGKFFNLLEREGYEFTDPGSGPQTGRSQITGDVKLLDYQAATRKGSNENRTLQEISGGNEWIESQNEIEGKSEKSDTELMIEQGGFDEFEVDTSVLGRQQALVESFGSKPSLTPAESAEAQSVFPKEPNGQLQLILRQMFDGMTTRKEIIELQTYMQEMTDLAAAKKLAVKQVEFAERLARARGLIK